MTEKISCALYIRVSSRNQVNVEYNSLETQKEKLEAYCKSQEGYEIYQVYEDGAFSADSLNRPALQRMLGDIQTGKIQCVIAYKIDRLTRSVKDFHSLMEVFDRYKVRFISTTQAIDTSSPTGRLMRNVLLDFAQFEREMTADRTKDKMQQRANKGMWNGGTIPFGYKSENKKLIKNPQEYETLQFIFRQYYQDPSLGSLRKNLKQNGYSTRNGKPWSKTTIDRILRNPIYCGLVRFGDKTFKGEHEPLIEEALFQAVQSRRRQSYHPQTKLKREYLLKGLLKCTDCGSFMSPHYTLKKKKDGTTYQIAYYRCTKTMHIDNKVCSIRSVSADGIEKTIVKYLSDLSNNEGYVQATVEELNKRLMQEIGPMQEEADRLKKHLDEIEREVSAYVKAFGKANLSLERLEAEVGRLEKEKAEISMKYEEMRRKVNEQTIVEFNAELVKKNLLDFSKSFYGLAPGDQAEALQCILKDVLVYPDKLSLEVFEMPAFTPGSQNRHEWLPVVVSNLSKNDK